MWLLAVVGLSGFFVMGAMVQASSHVMKASPQERTMITTQSKFYCNIKALTPTERARHKELTNKLIAERKLIVEKENGFEFQYSPSTVSLGELAEWVAAEGKCCPFFDFHIDLEKAGTLLCLRLMGADGIKPFIESEFRETK
jgi:hypothetical protein